MNKVRPLTREEATKVIQSCKNEKYKLALAFMYMCGLRISEVLSLKWSDVLTSKGKVGDVLYLKKQIQKRKNPSQIIPLPKSLQKALQKYYSQNGSSPYIFEGLYQPNIHNAIKEICDKVGIDSTHVSCHSFRKSYGMHIYNQTKDIFLTSQALRHKNPANTIYYLELDKGKLIKAINNFGLEL